MAVWNPPRLASCAALTLLATQENPIPEKWARRLVRLMLQRTPPPAAGEGA